MFSINERMSSFVDDYSWESKVKVRREARNNELYEDRQCVVYTHSLLLLLLLCFSLYIILFLLPSSSAQCDR